MNAAEVHVTRHAIERYVLRRGWRPSIDSNIRAEKMLRELLERCADQNPPIVHRADRPPSRRYRTGDLVLVVATNPDQYGVADALVTFYQRDSSAKGQRRSKREADRRHDYDAVS